MATKKSKSKITREDIEINIPQADPAQLAKFADTPQGKDSPFFATPDGSGVTIGRSLDCHEYEGIGLPDWTKDRALFAEIDLNFTVRVTCDREGTTYLEIHQAGHRSFYSFPFKGIEYSDLHSVVPAFENNLSSFLISYGVLLPFFALYWKGAEKKDRDEAYDTILEAFKDQFKAILKPKRKREIGKREIGPGVTVTTYESIESGANPKSEAEKKAEKEAFLEQVFRAFSRIETEGGKRTQLDVGNIIFEYAQTDDIQSLMKNRCRTYGLKWSDVKAEYDRKKV